MKKNFLVSIFSLCMSLVIFGLFQCAGCSQNQKDTAFVDSYTTALYKKDYDSLKNLVMAHNKPTDFVEITVDLCRVFGMLDSDEQESVIAEHESDKNLLFKLVQDLIASGANVNFMHPDFSNFTVLDFAITVGYADLVELLIQAGADVNHKVVMNLPEGVTTGLGQHHIHVTPLSIAMAQKMVLVPFMYGTDTPTVFREKDRIQIVKSLLAAGADTDEKDDEGNVFADWIKSLTAEMQIILASGLDLSGYDNIDDNKLIHINSQAKDIAQNIINGLRELKENAK